MVRRVFQTFLFLGLAACSVIAGPTGPTGPGPAVGTYTLQTINQQELPAKINNEGRPLGMEEIEAAAPFLFEITAGSATLNEDWTCSLSLTRRETEDGIMTTNTETDSCTYTIPPDGWRGLEMRFDDFWAAGSAPVTTFDSTLSLIIGNDGDINLPTYIFEK